MEQAVITKRPDSFEEFRRKRAAQHPPLPPSSHNEPDLPSLSHAEHTFVEGAREALATMKRTFEFWIVVARGLQVLKDKADRIGGRFTFDRLREREGLGGKRKDGSDILNKTRVSRLLAILDNEAEVVTWRAKLSPKQQFEWASPEAVYRHCPVFAKPTDAEPRLSEKEQLKQEVMRLEEENHKLRRQRRENGDTFNPKTTPAREIAVALIGQLRPYPGKAKKVVREMLAILEPQPAKKRADAKRARQTKTIQEADNVDR
jgi:hypothetical protein